MSSTNRQNRLLLAEDWKKVYQSFRNAEFKSYDFDNLRRTMINYLRQNYPEDFNDYIESSEYLALIDLIAFLGQNISYRIDLNARENFLELAERRESVLRLARLLSYNPKRNQTANGLLKFESVSTSEDIVDSNGTNLSNQTVLWNDPANTNWREQFEKVFVNEHYTIIDDFGHHPTAIEQDVLKAEKDFDDVVLIIEFGSNTMKSGLHDQKLKKIFSKRNTFLINASIQQTNLFTNSVVLSKSNLSDVLDKRESDHRVILMCSNKKFMGIQDELISLISSQSGR